MPWTFYNSSGEALTNFGPVALTDLDIDGGTDIGEAIVDADLFIVDNGAGGTNVKTAASRIATYVLGSGAAQIATGTYTGNDAATQGITGVGFQPKYLSIQRRYTSDQTAAQSKGANAWTSTNIVDDNAAGMAITGNDGTNEFATYTSDIIRSLDSDGFTIGDGGTSNHPNANGVVYNYIAIG